MYITQAPAKVPLLHFLDCILHIQSGGAPFKTGFSLTYLGCAILHWHITGPLGTMVGGRIRSGVICGFGFLRRHGPLSPAIVAAFAFSYPRCNRLCPAHAKHSGNFDSFSPPTVQLEPLLLQQSFSLRQSVVECWHIEPFKKHSSSSQSVLCIS